MSTTSPKRWIGNVNLTSQCDITNSAHLVAVITMGVRTGGGKTGIFHPLDIGTKNQNFPKNLKSAA